MSEIGCRNADIFRDYIVPRVELTSTILINEDDNHTLTHYATEMHTLKMIDGAPKHRVAPHITKKLYQTFHFF